MGALHSLMCRVDQAVEHGDEARVALEELFRAGHAVLGVGDCTVAEVSEEAKRRSSADNHTPNGHGCLPLGTTPADAPWLLAGVGLEFQ